MSLVLGIAGGSGSGKSVLTQNLAAAFSGRCSVLCHDWYYKDNGGLTQEAAQALNFDHPDALETSLLVRHLDQLLQGRDVAAPLYDYATHSRLSQTRLVRPAPLIIVDGILILHEEALRKRFAVSVFVDVPDDIRLARRVRRDCRERRIDPEETLRLYEASVRPMHHRYVAPSARHAAKVWSQLTEPAFPDTLKAELEQRL